MKKIFTIKEGNTYTQLSWFCSTKYKTGEGIVAFKFAPELQNYLLELTSNYTQYQLKKGFIL
jgi:plasmid replication initiation protein